MLKYAPRHSQKSKLAHRCNLPNISISSLGHLFAGANIFGSLGITGGVLVCAQRDHIAEHDATLTSSCVFIWRRVQKNSTRLRAENKNNAEIFARQSDVRRVASRNVDIRRKFRFRRQNFIMFRDSWVFLKALQLAGA